MLGRLVRTSMVVVAAATAVAAAAATGSPATAAPAVPAATSKACKTLQAKAIAAAAANPAGGAPTSAERTYYAKCPGVDTIVVVSLGSLSRYQLIPDAKGRPVGIKKVTSSNPKVVALGAPVSETVDGKATNSTVVQAIGMGRSRVCFTPTSGAGRCVLVVTPKAIAGKAGGRTLNVAFGDGADDAAKVVSITSADPTVVTVAIDPSRALPYVVLGQPGTTTICAKYETGAGGCQVWTIGS